MTRFTYFKNRLLHVEELAERSHDEVIKEVARFVQQDNNREITLVEIVLPDGTTLSYTQPLQ